MIHDMTVDITPPAGESAVHFQPNVTHLRRHNVHLENIFLISQNSH